MAVFWLKFAYFQVNTFWLHVYEVWLGSVYQEGSARIPGAQPLTALSGLLFFVCP